MLNSIVIAGLAEQHSVELDPSANSRDSTARKILQNITQFSNGQKSAIFNYGTGGGSSSELNISIPRRSEVLDAKVELKGLQSLSDTVYNYNDTTNNSAWHGETPGLPTNEAPLTFEKTVFVPKEYSAITVNDTTMAEHTQTLVTKNLTYLYHLFKFKVTVANPTTVDFYWYGRSYLGNSIMTSWTNEISAFIFCPVNNTWVKFDHQKVVTSVTWQPLSVDKSIPGASSYINSSTNVLYIILVGPAIDPLMINSNSIGTDFVELKVYAGTVQYPKDVSFKIGAANTVVWSKSGNFDTTKVVSDGEGFKSKLQGVIEAAGVEEGTFVVPFHISTSSAGRIWIGNLSIQLRVLEHNDPPQFLPGNLGHFYMDEDEPATGDNLVDLSGAFTDDHLQPKELVYAIMDQEDPSKLSAALDEDGYHLDLSPAPDYYGTLTFRVNATDHGADEEFGTFDDLTRFSHHFNVTVRPKNDGPEIQPVDGTLEVNEGSALRFNVSVLDVDDTEFSWETNSSTKVALTPDAQDSSKVEVVITPDDTDTGKSIHFMLAVTDSGGGEGLAASINDHLNLSVKVINLNDPPRFVEVTVDSTGNSEPLVGGARTVLKGDDAAREDKQYDLSISAADPDLGIEPGEKLTFSIDAGDTVDGALSIDAGTGAVSFVPLNADVGKVSFTVTVTDWKDAEATHEFELEVRNTNDAPRDVKILKPAAQSYTENDTIAFQGSADDDDLYVPDPDEVLTYLWFTNHSSEPLGMGETLPGQKLKPGHYEITLKVVDSAGDFATDSVSIMVQAVIDDSGPDDGDGGGDGDGDGDGDGGDDDNNLKGGNDTIGDGGVDKSSIVIQTVLIGLVAAVIVIILFAFIILRRKGGEGDDRPGDGAVAGPGLEQPAAPVGPDQWMLQYGQNLPAYQPGYGALPGPGLEQPAIPVGPDQWMGQYGQDQPVHPPDPSQQNDAHGLKPQAGVDTAIAPPAAQELPPTSPQEQ